MAYSYSGKHDKLAGYLYFFGTLGTLGSAIGLSGFKPNTNWLWELLAPILIIAAIFSSLRLKSRSLLILGIIFLMAFIIKITGEYFTNTLGWPLSLVIIGLCLIALGYLAVSLNKKYFAKQIN